MRDLFSHAAFWWVGTAVCGGMLLLAVALLVRYTPAPNRRQRFGELGVVAALVIAALRFAPSWIEFSNPLPASRHDAPVTISVEREPVALAYRYSVPKPDVVTDAPIFVAPLAIPDAESTKLQLNDQSSKKEPIAGAASAMPTWGWIVGGMLGAYALIASAMLARWFLGQWALNRLI